MRNLRRVRRWVGITAVAVAVVLVAVGCGETTEREQSKANDVPVATLLYPTHGFQQAYPYEATGGRGTTHWNAYGPPGVENPFPWTGFTTTWPEIGWYASKDIETIKWQLEQMQRAGIDTVIISWSGWGDDNLDGTADSGDLHAQYQEAVKMMLDYIKANDIEMKFALLVEAFTFFVGGVTPISTADLTDKQRQMVTDYLWDNFYAPSKYGGFALHLDGKPTLFSVPDVKGGWWRNHDWRDGRFRLTEVSNNHHDEDEFTADYVYRDPPSAVPGVDGVVNIWPRFSSVVTYASNSPYFPWYKPGENLPEVDPLGIEGKYDLAWRTIIEHPRRSEIKLVWIWYWNSYWEVCYIEPDAGIGAYAVGDLYVRKTAHYANLFRAGLPFEPFEEADELSRYIGDVDRTELELRNRAENGAASRQTRLLELR